MTALARIRLDNIVDRETVYQRLLIVQGFVEGHIKARDTILVRPHAAYDAAVWQVNHGHFKALVPLAPGPNELIFEFFHGEFQHANFILNSRGEARQPLSVWYQRDRNAPPLRLALLVGWDSPALQPVPTQQDGPKKAGLLHKIAKAVPQVGDRKPDDRALVDAPPGEVRERLRHLDEVKRRFSLQAYLWQAFHAEQMRRMGLGRRTFALEDSHNDASALEPLPRKDLSEYPMVHVLVSRRTTREIRDPDNAQQNPRAKNRDVQHRFAGEVLEEHARCPPALRADITAPIAVLTLDATWDPKQKLLRGHAALGSFNVDGWSYGVMGSHWLWSAPSTLQETTAAFLDCSKTQTDHCVNDLAECDYAYETLNVGSGAMMHEVGHALNNPHWPSGLMARGYVEFNRAFMTREGPHCKRPGNMDPIRPDNDSDTNHLHRAQGARARWHPCFALPTDPPLSFLEQPANSAAFHRWKQEKPTWEPTPRGALFRCSAGIGVLEVYLAGEQYKTHIEFTGLPGGNAVQQEILISNEYISAAVGFDVSAPNSPVVDVKAIACNMREVSLQDFRSKALARPISIAGVSAVKSMALGIEDPGHQHFMHVFRQDLQAVIINSGAFVDGITFVYPQGQESFGGTGGSAMRFDIAPGERVAALEVRSGAWLDAVNIVLTSGRRSGWQGGEGGSMAVLRPSGGREIAGIYGSSNGWMFSLGLLLAA